MSKLFKTAIVEKRNILNEMRAKNLTLQELRFFAIYLSKINPYDKSTRIVSFPLEDFRKIMGFGRLNLRQIKECTDSLLRKIVHIPTGNGGYTAFQLFKVCRVDPDEYGQWYVSIDAHDMALPLMFDFKDKYLNYELWNILNLKSVNQIRMYEILKQFEKLGKREINIEELKELIGVDNDEYPRWDNFKTRVLDNCQQALKEKCDICYTYRRGKTGAGGKWVTVIFDIKKNKDYKIGSKMSLEDFLSQKCQNVIECEQENQKTEEKPKEESYGELRNLKFYASACGDEFNDVQMINLMAILNGIEFSSDEYGGEIGIEFMKYNCLAEEYSLLNVVAQNTKINDRYKYFRAMLIARRDYKDE